LEPVLRVKVFLLACQTCWFNGSWERMERGMIQRREVQNVSQRPGRKNGGCMRQEVLRSVLERMGGHDCGYGYVCKARKEKR